MRREDWAPAWLVLFGMILGCALTLLAGCSRAEAVTAEDTAPGMPLDAYGVVEYGAPAWLDECDGCYRIRDREGGGEWWLLHVETGEEYSFEDEYGFTRHVKAYQWVVLPCSGGDGE